MPSPFKARLACLLLLVAAARVDAQQPRLVLERGLEPTVAIAVLEGAPAQPFMLQAVAGDQQVVLAQGRLDGAGQLALPFRLTGALLESRAMIVATLADDDGSLLTATANCDVLFCEQFGFDFMPGGAAVEGGQLFEAQWMPVNLRIRAENDGPRSHPDACICFDSSNPTGGDGDLVTPGYGSSNEEPLGNLAIIAESMQGGQRDQIVNMPDDEASGGRLFFDWELPVSICQVFLLDVDEDDGDGADVRTYLDDRLVDDIQIPGLDDNNLQVALPEALRLDRLEVDFSGSGAVARIDYLPCPRVVNFDESTTGRPWGLPAGTVVTDQFLVQDFVVVARNQNPVHPDKAVLIDTARPTGGEVDLLTPGVGPGNTVPRKLAMAIADNDVDMDFDLLLDDPGVEDRGGVLQLDYHVCQTAMSITLLDVTEPGTVELFDIDEELLATFLVRAGKENGVQTIPFGPDGVPLTRHIKLSLNSEGAILEVQACPTPGADLDPGGVGPNPTDA